MDTGGSTCSCFIANLEKYEDSNDQNNQTIIKSWYIQLDAHQVSVIRILCTVLGVMPDIWLHWSVHISCCLLVGVLLFHSLVLGLTALDHVIKHSFHDVEFCNKSSFFGRSIRMMRID